MKEQQKATNGNTEEKGKYGYSDDAYERMGDDPRKQERNNKKM